MTNGRDGATAPARPWRLSTRAMSNVAAAGTALVGTLFAAALYASHRPREDEGPAIDQFEAIEASLAMKSDNEPSTQPQKDRAPPPPDVPPEGVSRDADATVPVTPPKETPKTPKDLAAEYDKFRRQTDDMGPASDPSQIGSSAGSDKGWAAVDKGDPYEQAIAGVALDFWEYPKVLQGTGVPGVCVTLAADGKIVKSRFREKTGDDTLDDAAARALEKLIDKWNSEPKPVPAHLLGGESAREICIRYTL